ncbi:MAG TPA: hypothetical protein VM890_13260 [Longimicrobium sp.]|jgi:hypothetical protein|nr:hypothetical protein [Longimicrobium sp.]
MNATTADAATSTFSLPENVGLAAPAPPLGSAALNPLPGWMAVLREQLASVGLALKREGMVVGACALLFTAFILWVELQNGSADMPLSPAQGIAAAMMALLIPMAVWKGEDPARRGYHHAMPLGHGAHAVARGAAGLAWTLAGVAAFFGWMGILSVITGGGVEPVKAWQWAAPFAGATVLYLQGSALTLVASHPWRWLGGAAVGYVFLDTFREVDVAKSLTDLVDAAVWGHYGITTVLTGLVRHTGYMGHPLMPDAGRWLTATFIWLATAVSLFLWAACRQPER